MSRGKVTVKERIKAAQEYIAGEGSYRTIGERYGVSETCVQDWVSRYKYQGALGFKEQEHNTVYSVELKQAAVEEYLNGGISEKEIAAKYGLRSRTQLQRWKKVYNSGGDFTHKMSGGSRMKRGRETTQEERIAIAKECLEHGNNYGEIAIKYNVSYQQVYGWTKKFKEMGEKGLEDRRGKRVKDQDPRTELEAAQIEIERLKHELYMMTMERDLLKKLEEIERGTAYLK